MCRLERVECADCGEMSGGSWLNQQPSDD